MYSLTTPIQPWTSSRIHRLVLLLGIPALLALPGCTSPGDEDAPGTTDKKTSNPGDTSGGDDSAVEEDSAEIVESSFPGSLDCHGTATATVTVQNTGSATWTRHDGYKLGSVGDEEPFYTQDTRVWLQHDETVEPGGDHTFTFELVAPEQEDVYITDWQMVHEHVQWFGETVSHDIVVSCPEQEEEAEWEYTEAIEDQVLASATWVRENFPDYFDLESIDSTTKRTIAYEMMTTVINDLRANGVDSSRCVANAGLPESDPFLWCSDALVVGPAGIGVTIDIYQSWSYPADPQTLVTGTASTGVVTSDLVDVSG
jgi:hypothetical protein